MTRLPSIKYSQVRGALFISGYATVYIYTHSKVSTCLIHKENEKSRRRAVSTEQHQKEQQHNAIIGTTEVAVWRGKIDLTEKVRVVEHSYTLSTITVDRMKQSRFFSS